MKTHTKILNSIAVLSLLFSGCYLKSVHPLIPVTQAELLEGLEGRWEAEGERWTFANDPRNFKNPDMSKFHDLGDGDILEEKYYMVLYEDINGEDSDTLFFLGTVGEFGGNYFLDLSIFELESRNSNFEDIHLFPVHTFSKIEINDGSLAISFFEDDWIKDLITSNRVRIKHERISSEGPTDRDEILITASTKELQKFVTKYGNDDEAFDKPIELKRVNHEL